MIPKLDKDTTQKITEITKLQKNYKKLCSSSLMNIDTIIFNKILVNSIILYVKRIIHTIQCDLSQGCRMVQDL